MTAAQQRIVEYDTGEKRFHLEYHCTYDDRWHLRLFDDGKPCVFTTMEEAEKYAKENPKNLNYKIHNL